MRLKRISNLIRQDLTNALRDNMLLYMIFAPILLALGARLLLPSLNQASLVFAVHAQASPVTIQRLEALGSVELLAGEQAVRARVLRSDDAIGLVVRGDTKTILMEGNEGEEAQNLAAVISHTLSSETYASYTRTEVPVARSLLTEYTAIIFIMIGVLLGALVMAFNTIEDKETRAIKALGVSPLSILELTAARGLFAILLGVGIVLATTFILVGNSISYLLLLAALGFSLGLPVLTGYLIGGLADSQLKAIALLKFYMMVYLTLPIVTIFIPRQWHFFFYALPNYWMWQTFENVFLGQVGPFNLWTAGLITLASSLALVLLLAPTLRRQMSLR
jgi:ABC-2 type transport system permease protein